MDVEPNICQHQKVGNWNCPFATEIYIRSEKEDYEFVVLKKKIGKRKERFWRWGGCAKEIE